MSDDGALPGPADVLAFWRAAGPSTWFKKDEALDAEIRALFERGQREGEFRPDLSAVWLTEAFYNLVGGAAWVIQVGRAARYDFTQMITDLLLHGVSRS